MRLFVVAVQVIESKGTFKRSRRLNSCLPLQA